MPLMFNSHYGPYGPGRDTPRAMPEPPATVIAFPASAEAIELRHLRTFVAVAEELSFGRAAARLFITQPAVSRQIRSLEQLVGCRLLRRTTRTVELTLAGEALLERARGLLLEVDAAVVAVQTVGGEIMARIASIWEGVGETLRDPDDLQAQRAAWESLLAQFDPPENTGTRAVNTDGVAGLVQGMDPASSPGVLFVHGGSYVLGSAFGYRPLAGALAQTCATNVLIPEYRLAPEHPFPAALNDIHRAYTWMLQQDINPREIVLVGDSCGATITLALLLKCRDAGTALPGGAILLTPAPSVQPVSAKAPAGGPFERMVQAFWDGCAESYLDGHPADDPLVNPLLGDLAGLPPLLIQAGTRDLALDAARAVHDHAIASGVSSKLELYPAEAHSFHLFWSFLPEAVDALRSAGTFVGDRVAEAHDHRIAQAN